MSDLPASVPDSQLVSDVMLRDPKTLPWDASVEDVRAVLANPSVQMVLLDRVGSRCVRTDGEEPPSPRLATAVLFVARSRSCQTTPRPSRQPT